MIFLVTGGRDYAIASATKSREVAEREAVQLIEALDRVLRKRAITVLVEGEAPGADKGSRAWAELRGVPVRPVPVDHALDGPWPGAGPRRNLRQLKLALELACDAASERETTVGEEFACVGFPGGSGTASMLDLVTRAGYGDKIWRPYG